MMEVIYSQDKKASKQLLFFGQSTRILGRRHGQCFSLGVHKGCLIRTFQTPAAGSHLICRFRSNVPNNASNPDAPPRGIKDRKIHKETVILSNLLMLLLTSKKLILILTFLFLILIYDSLLYNHVFKNIYLI